MQSVDKKYFAFSKGINTEAPLVQWPEGFTLDEQNFDLLIDGSRRRRLGISYESGGTNSNVTCPSVNTDQSSGTRFYRWKNVNNNDDADFIVGQLGSSLYFWQDPQAGPMGTYDYEFSLLPYRVEFTDPVTNEAYTASDDAIERMVCSITEIDGALVVAGEHIEPLRITLEDNAIVGEPITIMERDLFGIDDGLGISVKPAVLTDEHKYNLYNRGWEEENINTFFTSESVYPSKNMIQFLGLRKQTEDGWADESGIKVFSPDKLVSELFSNMSAPQGRLSRNVFDWRYAFGSGLTGIDEKVMASVTVDSTDNEMTISTVDADHGCVEGTEIYISGLVIKIRVGFVEKKVAVSGVYTVKRVVDADTIVVDAPLLFTTNDWAVFLNTTTLGSFTVGGKVAVEFEGFEPAKTRFTKTAAFAGRIFYAGCPDIRISNRVYYSKTIEYPRDLGICYQEADPTSEYISDLIPTDGGYITIPNLGIVRGLLPYGNALIVFASEGIWAIGPGEGGIFSAVGYSVNKISDAGCIAAQSIVMADNIPMYWSEAGIYAIVQDSNSGFLTAQNISQNVINSLYHSIRHTEKTRVKATYDAVRKRVFFLFNSRLVEAPTGDPMREGESSYYSTSVTPMGILNDFDEDRIVYDTALIFDLRLEAWIKWYFNPATIHVRDILCLPTNYSTDSLNGALRFICQEQGTQKFYLGELTDAFFLDWGTEAPAYVLSGPDSLGEPERFRYAPYVHVFMRKASSEPKVIDQDPDAFTVATTGDLVDLTVRGKSSSIFMQARWDWSRGSNSGKMSNYVQVFRETKPSPDSFGMIVTKNKVRGRGRNLFLCFKAGSQAPAWIEGWAIKYDAQVRI